MSGRNWPIVAAMAIAILPGEANAQSTVADWSGLYAGIYGGYGEGTVTASNSNSTLDTAGYFGGAFVGYGWEVGPTIFRLEGDVGLSDLTNVVAFGQARIDSVASLSARVGLPSGPVLPYLAAGGVLAQATLDDGSKTASTHHVGYSLAAGVEMAFGDNLALRAEAVLLKLFEAHYPDAPGGPASIAYETALVRGGAMVRF